MAQIIGNILPKVNRKFITYDIIGKFAQNSGGQIMHYYERIKELRQDRDKTQTEIAEYLQIDQSYYSKYERGKHPIPIEILTSLCKYYGVSADYVLGLPKGLNWPR